MFLSISGFLARSNGSACNVLGDAKMFVEKSRFVSLREIMTWMIFEYAI